MANIVEVKVPNIGDFENVEIIEVLVGSGDKVKVEDSLITLESDKASMDVPSPLAGAVRSMKVKTGDRVSEGDVILELETEGEKQAATEPKGEPSAPKEQAFEEKPSSRGGAAPAGEGAEEQQSQKKHSLVEQSVLRPSPTESVFRGPSRPKAHASPSVRRFAREMGVDLNELDGSGPRQRILIEDVKEYMRSRIQESRKAPLPSAALPREIDYTRFGEIREEPLTKINEITASRMSRSWQDVPHVTQQHEADITDLEAFRKKINEEADGAQTKTTLLPFIMKAVVSTLRQHPRFNSSLSSEGTSLILRQFFNIGVAVDTNEGLMVPVLRDVDKKGIIGLARELAEVSERARSRRLRTEDLEGGCFSISNLGSIGGGFFTPIVNAPEVAVLGVSRASMKPTWNGETFVPRLLLPLSLSYDHRVIDGALGAKFVTTIANLLFDPRRLLL